MLRGWLLLALTLLASPTHAAAQRAPHIDYEAPAQCPPERALREAIERSLHDVTSALPALEPVLRIAREGGTFRATLRLREQGSDAARELSDPSCTVLADAVVMIVAVALAPGLDLAQISEVAEAASGSAQDAAAQGAVATESPSQVDDAEPAALPGPRLRGALRLAAHGSYGALPGVVIGAELGGSVLWDALRIDLGVRGVPLVGARFGVDGEAGGDLGLVLALARAQGVAVLDPHVELTLGGGLEAGAALGRGVGLATPRDTAAPWVALEAALGLSWVPLAELALSLELEAIVPVVRPVFTVEGLGVLYRPEPVVGALRFFVEARFG